MEETRKLEQDSTVYYKPVKVVLEEGGFKFYEPINFGQIETEKEIQEVLYKLKGHPRAMIYEFIEKELDKRKAHRIAQRQRRKKRYQNKLASNPDKVDLRNKSYFLQSREALEKRYEEDVKHDLIKTMKWYDDHVLNKK